MKPSTRTLPVLTMDVMLLVVVLITASFSVKSHAQEGTSQTFLLQHNRWEQLVLPGNPAGSTIESLFGDALDINDYARSWVVYIYDGIERNYVNPGINGTIRQAEAFWIIQSSGVDVTVVFPEDLPAANLVQSEYCSSSAGCAEVPLASRAASATWTMVGYPLVGSLQTDQISVVTESVGSSCFTGCTLDEAVDARYISNEFWHYDSAQGSYVDLRSRSSVKTFEGFWVSTLPDADGSNPVLLLPDNSSSRKLPGVPHQYRYEGEEIFASNGTELQTAIANAQPGDVITLSSGTFELDHRVTLNADGSATNPIVLRASDSRESELIFSQLNGIVEGFVVRGNYWIIDGFELSSDCTPTQHSRCEHAVHVKSDATGLIIRNNKIVDFNAAIKGSGSDNLYANNVRIEHNEIFNTSARQTRNPVTPIDINGGDSWRIYKNSIYDFSKAMGNQVSYGAFLKANSSNGVMDSNWLQCEKSVSSPGARIGLSFGGGGNSPINSPICKDSDCSRLHRNGRMTNNLISNCSDVGIYINASSDTLIDHNTLYSTNGIDVRFDTSTARLVANILVDGSIRERQGGQVLQNEANALSSSAVIPSLPDLLDFIVPHSVADPLSGYDICGYQRETRLIGAVGGSEEERQICVNGLF